MPGVLKNIAYSDPFTRYRGQKLIDVVKRLGHSTDSVDLELAIDILYALYLPFPRLIEMHEVPLGHEKHYQIISALLSLDETKKLRLYTVADSFLATSLGALVLMHILEETSEEQSESEKSGGEKGEGAGGTQVQTSRDEEVDSSGGKSIRDSVRRAVEKAVEKVEAVREIKNLVCGYRAGVGHTLGFEDVTLVLKLVERTDISELLKWLEKLPSLVSIARRKKYAFPKGVMEGFAIGSDLERLVPTELAYPEVYFHAKLADSRLLLYDKYIYASLGPIYVLIDKSGSMEGEKLRWAKATALALFLRSRIEKRPFYIRFFDSEPFNLIRIKPSAKPSHVLKMLEYIAAVKGGGGTDISKAIITACNDIAKYRFRELSDIVLITDGEDRIARSLVKRSLQQSSARLVSVMIMGDNNDLKNVSEKYFRVIKLDEKEMLQVIEA
ncbi:MAG: VWA domain-containing protein [Crenarchaeota archaeon]|nr:VWA domain-containing protein [Thermoproteota archaeon]